jgi:hypothetical protein
MKFEASSWRKWIVPISALSSAAVLVFAALYLVDYYGAPGPVASGPEPLTRYVFFSPSHITDALPSLAGMIAAVLGIVITVVSIVVQLSASRYHGVANMFLRDRTNIAVMGYYVVACVCGVLVSLSIQEDFVPRVTVLAVMVATALGLVLMAPYFAYVFWFLEPTNIIARIRAEALRAAAAAAPEMERCERGQAPVLGAMEELTDIVSNSISGKDKIIASRAVDAIKDLVVDYLAVKPRAAGRWFELGPHIHDNPDFVAMEPESREDLVQRRTWVEWKAMRQYLGIYNESLAAMPDINYLIAIDTRYIGEAAAKANDAELVELVFRYMNSYLRATLNARAVRIAYNVLNQYRQLVEVMLRTGHGRFAALAAGYMTYYGHVGFDMKLPFVTETVAYDVGTLCEIAHEIGSDVEEAILQAFLELDRATTQRSQEQALKGVRKAQVKLAAYYLTVGERDKARLVYRDMEHDPPERLAAIRDELDRVETKDFWEIIDRGRNFEYMPPKQKAAMRRFFTWFEGVDSRAVSSVPPAMAEAEELAPTTPRQPPEEDTPATPPMSAERPEADASTPREAAVAQGRVAGDAS